MLSNKWKKNPESRVWDVIAIILGGLAIGCFYHGSTEFIIAGALFTFGAFISLTPIEDIKD